MQANGDARRLFVVTGLFDADQLWNALRALDGRAYNLQVHAYDGAADVKPSIIARQRTGVLTALVEPKAIAPPLDEIPLPAQVARRQRSDALRSVIAQMVARGETVIETRTIVAYARKIGGTKQLAYSTVSVMAAEHKLKRIGFGRYRPTEKLIGASINDHA